MTQRRNQTVKLILTLSCPDRPGIVHAVSGFLFAEEANIVEASQLNDASTGLFFMRVKFECPSDTRPRDVEERFASVSNDFAMQAKFSIADRPMPTVIMVSQIGHCLNDLLFRHRSGLLPIDIRAIVSNHRDFYQLAASYDLPFHYIPVTSANKPEAEQKLLDIFQAEGAELLVLARYMQVLSNGLCQRLSGQVINIHHSFLPSFKGARPYQQAFDRGVKLIGATAHYVTADLDEGPIIEQGVERVDHAMDPATLTAIGRDTENVVLARAVKWHAEHRILLNGYKTVVFQ
ncbi:formyltetrahydrofolate deformylase [Pseudomonas sp. UL073]|uniref:Formyltetrahydrofolate deformylase n=1 Tax=Zestomonas insulae TaxID=2809017 RepID=A0ABS2ID44_9GAMM|nr:formyltetrahydrofolate deformylase [Pseudomonas insulae]